MTPTDPADLLAGRYRLGAELGRGGMGRVLRAHDELLDRDVAVKILDVAHPPESAVSRFRREARFLAGLAHPNVVTVFDFGVDDARAWLVMELLAGPTLQALVEQRGPLPVADVARYGRQCAAALAAAHAAGITHRDVKPANVMLSGDGTCKLLDLGIARLSGGATTQPALTQAGTILGSVPYLAPEVITGAAPEPPADLYALGGVLYALLTARAPFQGEEPMAAMAQHVHAPPPRPSAVRGDVPPDLDDLVVALLAKDPAQRPAATDVVARLDGSPAPAAPPTLALAPAQPGTTQVIGAPVAPPAAANRRRRPALLAGAAALALVLLAAVIALANAGGDTAGQAGLQARATPRTSSPPAHPSSSPPSSPARTTPAPATLSAALTALRSAIRQAQSSGGLSSADAQDLLQRADAISAAAAGGTTGDQGHGAGPGHGHGNAKGHADGGPAAAIDDFSRHLSDLANKGAVSSSSYSAISHALDAVRSLAGTGSTAGGGDGGD